MGINNFCVLLNSLHEPLTRPKPFDSILYDAQSLLHVSITLALEAEETKLFREMCRLAWSKFQKQLNALLSFPCSDALTLILSFDGDGVPMKWPTQRARRTKKDGCITKKSTYRAALFGTNVIALKLQNYFKERLKQYKPPNIREFRVVISGCNVPGEGEHKLFQMAEAMACRNPLVASEDQDVFVLALLRLTRYESIQIYRYGKYYPVTDMAKEGFPYPVKQLETCSFLFGNDFIPPIVSISFMNAPIIHQCLHFEEDDDEPEVLARFLQTMNKHLRWEKVTHLDSDLVDSFWITFLWLQDYYTQSHFPQKYIHNTVYDRFDRNMLLTALSMPEISRKCYERAKTIYGKTRTSPVSSEQAIEAVFTDDYDSLKAYWLTPTDKACVSLRLVKNE